MEMDRAHGRRREMRAHGHRWKDNAVLVIRGSVGAWITVPLKGWNSSNIWEQP